MRNCHTVTPLAHNIMYIKRVEGKSERPQRKMLFNPNLFHSPIRPDFMQLTAQNGNMIVDFYPVKFASGEIHNRLVLKVVTFMGQSQSKRYINKKDVQSEVDSRVFNYDYQVTAFNTDAQLFNSALACAC